MSTSSNPVFGGDETGALVIDVGSYMVKAGYAGEDTPKAYFASATGRRGPEAAGDENKGAEAAMDVDGDGPAEAKDGNGDPMHAQKRILVGNALNYRRDGVEVVQVYDNGQVADWDAMEAIWTYTIKDQLLCEAKEHPILLAEPSCGSLKDKERTCELMFETLEAPALFIAKNAALSSFSTGRATSLVVDSGHQLTTVTPVHDGYVLQKGIAKSGVAGKYLTEVFYHILKNDGIEVKPRYSFRRKAIGPGEYEIFDLSFPKTAVSFREWQIRNIMSDLKESVCQASDKVFDDSELATIPTVPYELPDGQQVEVGGERYKIPDIMFNPQLAFSFTGCPPPPADPPSTKGLPGLIMEAVDKCDPDLKKEMLGGVLLTGGNSAFRNMKERLEKDLVDVSPSALKLKLIASTNLTERKFSAWLGGSILASLGSFQQMWMSKKEYDELGSQLIHRKCP